MDNLSNTPVPARQNTPNMKRTGIIGIAILIIVAVSSYLLWGRQFPSGKASGAIMLQDTISQPGKADTLVNNAYRAGILDTILFTEKMQRITNRDSSGRWPVKAVYPLPGAIFPFKRVLAFYGNLYSKQMGILGELPEDQMLEKLKGEIKKWQAADTTIQVIPALHYIAVTAQESPGSAKKYRLRMPFQQIDKVLKMAEKINALVFIDVQVGLSNVQSEIPEFERYLKMPHVHLGIDPEFSMKGGQAPGKVVGTYDAADINFTTEYLAKLVRENNLPPKILVVHRFTEAMVTNYKHIKLKPEVQIVMDMDGWGHQARKKGTYQRFIYGQPVQFTGFKIFYKNDLREKNSRLMTADEVLRLNPQPVYIQYQ